MNLSFGKNGSSFLDKINTIPKQVRDDSLSIALRS